MYCEPCITEDEAISGATRLPAPCPPPQAPRRHGSVYVSLYCESRVDAIGACTAPHRSAIVDACVCRSKLVHTNSVDAIGACTAGQAALESAAGAVRRLSVGYGA